MIFPIAHDTMVSRRWPVATTVIIAICFAVLIWQQLASASIEKDANIAMREAMAYHDARPYLPVPPVFEQFGLPARGAALEAPPGVHVQEEQEHLDALAQRVQGAIDRLPHVRFGFIPGKFDFLGLIGYQFLHAGWIHLLGNMWFLWLCGCNLEDRWGARVYVPFYIIAGMVAGLGHMLVSPNSPIPLIGASGAVAGAMGAFLVLYARARIRFVAFVLWRAVVFSAPAYVMLPLWMAGQALSLWFGVEDGTAYGAHVGGFALGMLVGGSLLVSGLDKKLDAAMDRAVTVVQDPRLVQAGDWVNEGRASEALSVLSALAREKPMSIDVHLEMLRAAKSARDEVSEWHAYERLIELYLRASNEDTAMELLYEMQRANQADRISPALRIRLADRLARKGLLREATTAYATVYSAGLSHLDAVRATVAQARVSIALGHVEDAHRLLLAARESPFATVETDQAVDEQLAAIAAQPARSSPAFRL